MTLKSFIIYGAGISAACMLIYGAGCSLSDWLRDRREDMRMARAIRLGRLAHEPHSYEIQPLSEEELQELEDWAVMVETSDDEAWIRDGIELLSLHATWAQRPKNELEDAA